MSIEEEFYKRLTKKAGVIVHEIKSGENIGMLSRKYKVTLQQIYDANPGVKLKEKPRSLQPGQKVNVPESIMNAAPLLKDKSLSEQIQTAAEHAGISSVVLEAMVNIESGGQTGAVSEKGAQGLGQLMPAVLKLFNVTDPQDPAQNLLATAQWLSALLKTAPGTTEELKTWHALMKYNWSPAKFDSWYNSGKVPSQVPKETRNHTRKVFGKMGWNIPDDYKNWYL